MPLYAKIFIRTPSLREAAPTPSPLGPRSPEPSSTSGKTRFTFWHPTETLFLIQETSGTGAFVGYLMKGNIKLRCEFAKQFDGRFAWADQDYDKMMGAAQRNLGYMGLENLPVFVVDDEGWILAQTKEEV